MQDGGRTRRLGFALPAYADGIGVLFACSVVPSNNIYNCFLLKITITYMLQAYSLVDINICH